MLQAMQMQGAMNQNELARYSLASAQRTDASQNAVNAALKGSIVDGKINYDLLTSNLAGGAGASKIPDFLKARSEEEKRTQDILKTKGDIDKQTRDAVDAELISFAKNAHKVVDVPSLTSHTKAFFAHPLLGKIASRFKTYEQALADDIKQISTPEGLSQWQTENANLTGKELIELLKKVTKRTQNVGTEDITYTENQLGQQIGPVVRTPIGVSPNTTATLKQAQDHYEGLSAYQKEQLKPQGIRPADVQKTEIELNKQYTSESKGFIETKLAIYKAKAALKDAATNPTAGLSAGTAFMKILDARSVVRETELAMALESSGWFDRVTNIANTLLSGKTILTPTQITNLNKTIDGLFEEVKAEQRIVDSGYARRAKSYGLDVNNIITDRGQNKIGITEKTPTNVPPIESFRPSAQGSR
jgi:hypothetical protein